MNQNIMRAFEPDTNNKISESALRRIIRIHAKYRTASKRALWSERALWVSACVACYILGRLI